MADDDETRKSCPARHPPAADALGAIRCALPEVKLAAARFAVAMRRRDYDAAAIAADDAVALFLAAKAALRRASSTLPSHEPESREMRYAVNAAYQVLQELFSHALEHTSGSALRQLLGQLSRTIELAHEPDPPAEGGIS